jgi:hypothetical protein
LGVADLLRHNVSVAKQNSTYTTDKIVDMHGKLKVSKEQNLWKDQSGGSVEMTRVQQDRGVSWDEAMEAYDAAKQAGQPVMLVQSKHVPVGACCVCHSSFVMHVCLLNGSVSAAVLGYTHDDKFKQFSLCVVRLRLFVQPCLHHFPSNMPHLCSSPQGMAKTGLDNTQFYSVTKPHTGVSSETLVSTCLPAMPAQ